LLHVNNLLHVDESVDPIYFRNNKSSDATKIKEIQANQFAAELLMPEDLLINDVKSGIKQEKDLEELINELADVYNVSVQSMSIRLGKLVH
jgi:Zn-dependent peptidase ImmA (M78 family)